MKVRRENTVPVFAAIRFATQVSPDPADRFLASASRPLAKKQRKDALYFARKAGVNLVWAKTTSDKNSNKQKSIGPPPPPLSDRQVYFYHPDHLGTATLLTDINGQPYQYFLNLPFGEEMAAQRAGGPFSSRYKFNGKELDKQTCYYYYGARYYDPVLSRWLSVDPLAEKYPGFSPYNYTADNPIMLVDPDGKKFDEASKKIANATKQKLQNKITELKKQGKGIGDLNERIKELRKSIQDIEGMDTNTELIFSYQKVDHKSDGETIQEGNHVTMKYYDEGGLIHETRHGGQIERGELDGIYKSNYSIKHEVDVYRAQYAYTGTYKYLSCHIDQNLYANKYLINKNMRPGWALRPIKSIHQINASMIRDIGELRAVKPDSKLAKQGFKYYIFQSYSPKIFKK